MGIAVIDESPAWLAARGRGKDAKEIIMRAAKINGVTLDPNFEVAPEAENKAGVASLFNNTNVFRTACLWSLNFTSHFAYYGVVLFLPRILGAGATDPYNFDALLISCVGEVVGSVAACALITRVSRRTLLAAGSLLLALSVPVLLLSHVPSWAMLAAALVARGSANLAASLTWIVTPEGYDVTVRATAHSWGNLLARVGALATTYWGGADVGEPTKVGSYVCFAVSMAAIAAVMPEGVMSGSKPEGIEGKEGYGDRYGASRASDKRT